MMPKFAWFVAIIDGENMKNDNRVNQSVGEHIYRVILIKQKVLQDQVIQRF